MIPVNYTRDIDRHIISKAAPRSRYTFLNILIFIGLCLGVIAFILALTTKCKSHDVEQYSSNPVPSGQQPDFKKYREYSSDYDKYKQLTLPRDSKLPLVSGLCLTRNRPELLQNAIYDFVNQTYTKKELVVMYDEDDSATIDFINNYKQQYNNLITKHNIHFYECPKNISIGEKRNISVKKALGKLSIIWDDDDRYDPERIEIMTKASMLHPDNAIESQQVIINNITTGKQYVTGGDQAYYPGTMIIPTQLLKNKYSTHRGRQQGEDSDARDKIKAKNKLTIVHLPHLYVYTFHEKNTIPDTHKDIMQNDTIAL